MNTVAQLIAEARNDDFRGPLQHLRSWEVIDSLLLDMADALEEAESRLLVLETLADRRAALVPAPKETE